MNIKYKGRRIKYSDKNLCNKILALSFFIPFSLSVFIFFKIGFIVFDTSFSFKNLKFPFFVNVQFYIALIVSVVFGFIVMFLIYNNKKFWHKQEHVQALARMIVENGWYLSESISDKGLFGISVNKEKITYFPEIYYKYYESHIYILIKVTMTSFQDNLLKLDKKIETGLFCELVEFIEKKPFYEYVFFCDLDKSRINISDVEVRKGKIKLMKGFVWKFDKLPHGLIVGGTGSGKSYFILTLIKALLDFGADLTILDPKNADLADLEQILPNVYHIKDDIVQAVSKFRDDMMECSKSMKLLPNYKTGSNYSALGLKPHFLIFDEYVAFIEMLDRKELDLVISALKQIAMLGRQSGYFLVLACQRPDARYLADGIRDQFHFRLALGRNSELGYKMVFGDTDKHFLTMGAGRGYVDFGKNVISQFYAPYVPNGYDFLKEIGNHKSNCEILEEDLLSEGELQ